MKGAARRSAQVLRWAAVRLRAGIGNKRMRQQLSEFTKSFTYYMYMYVYTVAIRKKTPACKLKGSRGRSAAVITVISLWESLLFFPLPCRRPSVFDLCIRPIYFCRVRPLGDDGVRSFFFSSSPHSGNCGFLDRAVYAAVMGYRIHKCRVKAAPRALLREGRKTGTAAVVRLPDTHKAPVFPPA